MKLIDLMRRQLTTIALGIALLAVGAVAAYSLVELSTTNAQLASTRQALAASQGALADSQSRLTATQQQLSRAQSTSRLPSLTLPATSEFVILQARLDDIDSRLAEICAKVGC